MKLSPEDQLAKEGMQLSKVGRRLLARAWDQGFDEGLKRPRTSTEAFSAPPAPKNPYRGRVSGRKKKA